MQGTMRVIPADGSNKSHRALTLRQAPTLSLVEDILGGKLETIKGFDSILHHGQSVECLALQSRISLKGTEGAPNSFANMLWLQAMVRRHGFAGTKEGNLSELAPRNVILGTVVVLFGEPSFERELLHSLLCLDEQMS